MPTFVLTTPSDPGIATWQDSTTLPVGGANLLLTTSYSIPALVAGDGVLQAVSGGLLANLNLGDPILLSWYCTALGQGLPAYLKVSANINAPGNVLIVTEAPVLQGTPPVTMHVSIYGF